MLYHKVYEHTRKSRPECLEEILSRVECWDNERALERWLYESSDQAHQSGRPESPCNAQERQRYLSNPA